jgi:hypothetical protein
MSSHYQFLNEQTNQFQNIYPNHIPSVYVANGGKVPDIINQLGLTPDSILTGSVNNPSANMNKFFVSSDIPDSVKEKDNFCSTASIDELLANQDPTAPMRCGWLYKEPPTRSSPYAQISRGGYGTEKEPINSPAGARWIWDLNKAKKMIMNDKCRAMTSCSMVEDSAFIGCGFSPAKQRGIPIGLTGAALYEEDATDNIITKSNQCPKPTVNDINTDSCKQLPNNKLSRDCIMRKVLDSGCSSNGTLYQALKGGNASNYAPSIDNNKAYNTYQGRVFQRGKEMLNKGMLKDGNITVMDALKNIKSVNDIATSGANDGLAFAARDLCLMAGEIDKFDFCSEISMTTPGPYSIDCLQKLFREKGGNATGDWWPSSKTIGWYNTTYRTWGDIIKSFDDQIAMIYGSGNNRAVAYKNMMGIQAEDPTVVRDTSKPCNINTQGNTYRIGSINNSSNVKSLSDCQQLCCDNSNCKAYNYIQSGGVRKCMLLSNAINSAFMLNSVSGLKN